MLLRFECAVQGDAGHTLLRSHTSQRVEGAVDLAAAGHEDENVAGSIVIDDTLDRLSRLCGDGALVGEPKIVHLHGIALPFGNEDRARLQIRGDGLCIERGGHY